MFTFKTCAFRNGILPDVRKAIGDLRSHSLVRQAAAIAQCKEIFSEIALNEGLLEIAVELSTCENPRRLAQILDDLSRDTSIRGKKPRSQNSTNGAANIGSHHISSRGTPLDAKLTGAKYSAPQERFKEAVRQTKSGKYAEAIDILDELLGQFPMMVEGLHQRARTRRIMWYEGNRDDHAPLILAEADLTRARELEPDSSVVLLELGKIQRILGKTTDSMGSLRHCIALGNANGRTELAILLKQQGQPGSALAVLEPLVEIGNVPALQIATGILFSAGRRKEGLAMQMRLETVDPSRTRR